MPMKKWKRRLKAKLRDWFFKDYKWITRAQIHHEICAAQWEYKDSLLVQRVLEQLKETLWQH